MQERILASRTRGPDTEEAEDIHTREDRVPHESMGLKTSTICMLFNGLIMDYYFYLDFINIMIFIHNFLKKLINNYIYHNIVNYIDEKYMLD